MTQLTTPQALNQALQHHQAGDLAAAKHEYTQILAAEPNHADALYLMGVLELQQGHGDLAAKLIGRAVDIQPGNPQMLAGLGDALASIGRNEEALSAYSQSVTLNPYQPLVHTNRGNVLKRLGRFDQAIDAHQKALALQPCFAEAYSNLGSALQNSGKLREAIIAYEHAIALKPDLAEAHFNLGFALQNDGKLEQAIAAYRKAIAFKPSSAEIHSNLGNVLRENKQLDEAISAQRQAIALNPGFSKAHLGLGNALKDQSLLDQAVASYRQVIALVPDSADAYSNLAVTLADTGALDEAIAAWERAISLKSDLPSAHHNLGLALLQRGDFLRGWQEYEWRGRADNETSPRREFAQPRWKGEPLQGKTILLNTEQGLGDSLQFVRYVPLVLQYGGKVVLRCPSQLRKVLSSVSPDCQVVDSSEPPPPLDVHCPLMSLPGVLGTTLETIPQNVPYLHANPADIEIWRQRLITKSGAPKVGLVWAGNAGYANDRNRSMTLAQLAPLSKATNVHFISLQKGTAALQAASPPAGMNLLDPIDQLQDLTDTAALIANLDLVIGVDTAVVHLAGAMGKPVWTLLPFNSDWRWLLKREDTPWYPTMRLFRQTAPGDWRAVAERVAELLTEPVPPIGYPLIERLIK